MPLGGTILLTMIKRICAFIIFRLCGWSIDGQLAEEKKYLMVVVPHTSNWDFVYGWLAIKALELDLKVFVKDSFFIWPFNYACRWFGVLPVNRRESTDFVKSAAAMYGEYEELIAVITPEGTRSFQASLKSGYYHLAKQAQVPIVLAALNFSKKTFVLAPPRAALSSFELDQENVIEFCRKHQGRHPQNTFQ